jgi:hypothetical protein
MWLSVKKKEKEKEKEKRKREWYDDIKIEQCHRCLRFADITMVHGWPPFAVLSISYGSRFYYYSSEFFIIRVKLKDWGDWLKKFLKKINIWYIVFLKENI